MDANNDKQLIRYLLDLFVKNVNWLITNKVKIIVNTNI